MKEDRPLRLSFTDAAAAAAASESAANRPRHHQKSSSLSLRIPLSVDRRRAVISTIFNAILIRWFQPMHARRRHSPA